MNFSKFAKLSLHFPAQDVRVITSYLDRKDLFLAAGWYLVGQWLYKRFNGGFAQDEVLTVVSEAAGVWDVFILANMAVPPS